MATGEEETGKKRGEGLWRRREWQWVSTLGLRQDWRQQTGYLGGAWFSALFSIRREGTDDPHSSMPSLICIKSETRHNFSAIHWSAFKLGHNVEHSDANSVLIKLVTWPVMNVSLQLSIKWQRGGEIPYNRYKLKCSWLLSCCPSCGSGRNGWQWCIVHSGVSK